MNFRRADVFLPSQEELLGAPSAETEMEGVIVHFSDSGLNLRAFAVIEMATGQRMVVPVEKLKLGRANSSGKSEP